MRILVTHGSKHGGTEGLARAVAEGIHHAGHEVDVLPAGAVDGLAAWDAVVVGGGLYALHWVPSAARFVRRHADELSRMPVWFFSSGPLDDSASRSVIPPTRQVRRLMRLARARGHLTFGGRLDPRAKGFIARALAKDEKLARDFRDLPGARDWGTAIGLDLRKLPAASERPRRVRPVRGLRGLTAALTLFTGLTAVVGGFYVLVSPGGMFGPDAATMLRRTPFPDFVLPGLLLTFVVGLGNLLAAWSVLRGWRGHAVLACGAGADLLIWMIVELAMIPGVHWLQILYVAIALATLASSFALWSRRPRSIRATGGPGAPQLRWRPV